MGKKKKKRKQKNDLLVLKLLILVIVVLVVFEGKMIYTMFTHNSEEAVSSGTTAKKGISVIQETETEAKNGSIFGTIASGLAASSSGDSVSAQALAGLSVQTAKGVPAPTASAPSVDDNRISEEIDSPAVIQKAAVPVDDSYFANSVFIGDSRMMGFRNSSGITQGTFLTSVGLSTDKMSDPVIATAEGNISVYQGLSGEQYDKIYLMLGTNDLGYYPWENFEPNFTNVVQQFHKLQPNAIIYICSVIYVDESKISTSYDNNDNVRKINGYLLNVCEALDYCYYLNLNEIFTNGYGSLLSDASSDGIHLYEKYCVQMLDYLKQHYVEEKNDMEDVEDTEAPEDIKIIE